MQARETGSTTDTGPDDAGAQADLAEGLRALSHDAWAKLYDSHHRQVWRYAFGRTGSADAADEATADVFAEALASIHRYRYRGRPILAWLYGIARNVTSKHLRQAHREVGLGDVEPSGGSLDGRLDSLVLTTALKRLTDDQREVVVLRYFAGYSTAEIAAAMGKREAAVYSLEVRAIAALRRQFEEKGRALPLEPDKIGPLPNIDKVR
jgi:RNA polymerase sigma-70 factor (ECF subfamily)